MLHISVTIEQMIPISCIVPTYKRVDQTIKTLELLFASEGIGQAFDLEVIIADSTPDVVLEHAVRQRFGETIAYVKPAHPGIAMNKNAGARLAKHPLFIFCDSDMEVEKNTIIRALEALKTHPTGAMVGGTVLWRTGPNEGKKDRPRPEDRQQKTGDTTYAEAIYSRFFMTYKDVFWSVGGYDEAVFNMRGEGSDLSIRYWRAGYPLIFDESVVVHHIHDVPDAAAVRIDHPEYGIARDYLLLAYKYGMFDGEYLNFAKTVKANFAHLGEDTCIRILEGIGKNMEHVVAAKPDLDVFRVSDKPKYDFKFLEIFTDQAKLQECITGAASLLEKPRASAFEG